MKTLITMILCSTLLMVTPGTASAKHGNNTAMIAGTLIGLTVGAAISAAATPAPQQTVYYSTTPVMPAPQQTVYYNTAPVMPAPQQIVYTANGPTVYAPVAPVQTVVYTPPPPPPTIVLPSVSYTYGRPYYAHPRPPVVRYSHGPVVHASRGNYGHRR